MSVQYMYICIIRFIVVDSKEDEIEIYDSYGNIVNWLREETP